MTVFVLMEAGEDGDRPIKVCGSPAQASYVQTLCELAAGSGSSAFFWVVPVEYDNTAAQTDQ